MTAGHVILRYLPAVLFVAGAVTAWLVWTHNHPRLAVVRRRFPGRRPPTSAEQSKTRGDEGGQL